MVFKPFHYSKVAYKTYKNDAKSTLQIEMPDETGNVYYPSGRLSMLISNTSNTNKIYSIFSDDSQSCLLAQFDTNGNAFCNYANGQLRYQINSQGGLNFDLNGKLVKRWSWPFDSHDVVFHPIIFVLNKHISVQILGRTKIYLNFRNKHGCIRLSVGSKIKLNVNYICLFLFRYLNF